MNRQLGLAIMAIGALTTLAGLAGLISDSRERGQISTVETTTALAATSTSSMPPTSTTTAATIATTTTVPSTTTTVPAADLIAAFVDQFVAWIAAGDVDSLLARLHPVVIDEYGTDLCRGFVEREILALEDYRLTGPAVGPDPSRYGAVTVDHYSAPVAFTFQGAEFTADAGFAFVDDSVHWFATCR